MNSRGIIIRESKLTVKATIDHLESKLKQNGVTVYARINQQAELSKNGVKIDPLEFIMFGNPAKGGLLISANPVTALDLPLKVIAWQDDKKRFG
ncbi:DUF302 domain-containing protein [Mucilaginibacter agri]|uniref:DUF302 domain-containing protein n=1 Tax=Mucilaginibacter agri TaxID=2695265 RepID=A0A966DTU1_9SPHI|nr:DUF302 domain-containing protein [Mucilaginibacter agri]NCD69761.1 DUF302 domain-containing protein [Mucilaginibacter agri]